MRSLRRWWTARSQPLSARGHLYAITFWLILAALVAHQLLTGDEDSALRWLLLAGALLNVAVLVISYRSTRRLRRETLRSSADGETTGTAGAE